MGTCTHSRGHGSLLTVVCSRAVGAFDTLAVSTTDALAAPGALSQAVDPEIVGLAGVVPTAAEAVVAGHVAVANVAESAKAIILAPSPPRASLADTVAGASEAPRPNMQAGPMLLQLML